MRRGFFACSTCNSNMLCMDWCEDKQRRRGGRDGTWEERNEGL